MLSAWAARMFENQRVLLDIAQKRQQARDAGHWQQAPPIRLRFPLAHMCWIHRLRGRGQSPYQTPSSHDGTLYDSE